MHPVSVVEEQRRSACPISQQSVETSIQAGRKCRTLLVEMDEIGWPLCLEPMPSRLEVASGLRFREFLARKDQNYITSFVTQHHAVDGIISPHAPAHVHAHGFVNPRSRFVERLVQRGLYHLLQLPFSPFTWHFGD